MPAATRELLIAAAVVPTPTAALAEAVSGHAGAGASLMGDGRSQTLARWIEALPDDLVARSGRLSAWWGRRGSWPTRAAPRQGFVQP